jgi:SAM-dependent methyltransferase
MYLTEIQQTSKPEVLPENRQAARMWGSGGSGYDRISRGIADAIEHAVDRLDPRLGERVLDIGTGTGWTARRAAARGAEVTGIDIGEDVIETARALDPEGRIDFRVADAEALPFPDRHFDGVISTFGIMFCGDPERASQELARVCKPSGRLSLATWAPHGSVFEMFKLIRSYMPPPKKVTPSPFEWGDTDRLVDLLGDGFNLGFEEATSFYRESSGGGAWQAISSGFGPVVAALQNLDEEGAARLRFDFETFHEQYRTGAGILVPRPYVITAGRRHLES